MQSIKFYILISLIAFSSGSLFAQQQRSKHPDPDKMHEKKWEFMKEKSGMTAQQAEAVKPVFMDYEKSVWKLHESSHALRKESRGKDKPDFEKLNDDYIRLETEQANMLKAYHEKLKKLLQPESLFNYYRAERAYKRQMVYEIQDNRPPNNGERYRGK